MRILNIHLTLAGLLIALFIVSAACNSKSANSESRDSNFTSGTADLSNENSDIAFLTEEQIKTVGIELGTLQQKEITSSLQVSGLLTVPNHNKGNASAIFDGVIQSLRVQPGDLVKKGQVIATIANPEFIRLQEEYLTLSSRTVLAEQEKLRQQQLSEGNAGARRNLENARSEWEILNTQKTSIERQLLLLGVDPTTISNDKLLDEFSVFSPVNGIISRVYTKIGSYIDVFSPVAEIVDNEAVLLDLFVYEKDLSKLKIGQKVLFRLANNPEADFEAEIYNIGAAFENNSKTILARAKILNDKRGLIDKMNATAFISLDSNASLVLPDDAIVESDGKFYVFAKTDSAPNAESKGTGFQKMEILKGITNFGYTAVSFFEKIPENTQFAVKNAFFINAKLTNTGEHAE